jgi:exoribonuclease R
VSLCVFHFAPSPEEIANRMRDGIDTLTFTIDPKDAKDFDDALSFKQLENGNKFTLLMFLIIWKKELF